MPIDFDLIDSHTAGPDFFTEPQTLRQRRTLKGARTETRRTERELSRKLGDDVLQAELAGGRIDTFFENPVDASFALAERVGSTLSTFTRPLFDILQAGQFASAGAALTLVNGGNSGEALRRASSEFLNALPYIDEQDAAEITGIDPTRASFRDVLDVADFSPFEDERHNQYATAAAGFLLDVVLDPTTYVGGAALRLAGGGAKMALLPFIDLPGVSQARNLLGRKFIPQFELKELARKNPQVAEQVEAFISGLRQRRGDITQGSIEIKEAALQLRASLTAPEARVLQLYMDQPRHFQTIVKQLTAGNPATEKFMMKKFDEFKGAYKKLADEEVKMGILDPTILRADYAPARWEETQTSARAFKELMQKLGIPEVRQSFELSELKLAQETRLLGEGVPTFAKGKKLNTLEQRVLAAIGTELDPGVAFAIRGVESVRARATRRFVNSVLNDPAIAVKITDPSLLMSLKKGGAGLTQPQLLERFGTVTGQDLWERGQDLVQQLGTRELGVWRPFKEEVGDVLSMRQLRKGRRFLDDEGITYTVGTKVRKGQNTGMIRAIRNDTNETVLFDPKDAITPFQNAPAYVMPREFIDELRLADNIIGNRSEGRRFFEGLGQFQNLWKGWAVTSPGFHARNGMSNLFNNELAGVHAWSPTYAKAFSLIFGGGSKTTLKLKDGTVLSGKEIIEEARRHNIINTGLFARDIPEDIEKKMFDRMYRSGAKNKEDFLKRLDTADEKSLGAVIATVDGTQITRRELIEGVVDTSPARADFQFWNTVFGSKNPVLKANRWVGEKVEDHARLTHFMDKVGKGMTSEEAAVSVKRYLFDYGELTAFERDVMKLTIPFYCVSEDTECLTVSGWKKYDEIAVGDDLVTVNIDSRKVEVQKAKGVAVFEYDGELLHFENRNIDILMTPNHRCIYHTRSGSRGGDWSNLGWRMKEARDVKDGDWLPIATDGWENKEETYSDDFVKLAGWVITEGCYYDTHIVITQSPNNHLKEIKQTLDSLGYDYSVNPKDKVVDLRIKKKDAEKVWEILPEKELSFEFLFSLSRSQLEILYETLIKADGYSDPKGGDVFLQVNQNTTDAFQCLCVLLGKASRNKLQTQFYGNRFSDRPINRTRAKSVKYVSYYNKESVDYKGKVWCPSVDNGTIFIRRNGKVMPTGQTWMRKNIPLQFQEIARNPGRYARLTAKPIEAIESLSKDWADIPTPDYFQELHAVRMPQEIASLVKVMNERFDDAFREASGSEHVRESGLQPVFLNPNFPFQDLNSLNMRNLISGLSPIAKLPIELMLGEQGRGFSLFLDRPIERFQDEPTEFGFLGSESRPSRKAQHFLETAFPTVGKIQRFMDRTQRGQAASQIATEFLGVKFIQVDVDRARRGKVYRRRDKLRAIKQKYTELGLL